VAKIRFGSVAVALEMIPIANLVFMWTNIVACALWVADEIERDERRQMQQQQEQIAAQDSARSGSPSHSGLGYFSNSKASTSLSPPSHAYMEGSLLRQQPHELGSPDTMSTLSGPKGSFRGWLGSSSRTTQDSDGVK